MTDSPMPTRRRTFLLATVAAVLLIGAGVAIGLYVQRDTPATVTLPDGTSLEDAAGIQAALPACAEVFREGQRIDEARGKAGCNSPRGATYWFDTENRCKDGRLLFAVEAGTGAVRGWGFAGDIYHLSVGTAGAADPAYSAAYQACYG